MNLAIFIFIYDQEYTLLFLTKLYTDFLNGNMNTLDSFAELYKHLDIEKFEFE